MSRSASDPLRIFHCGLLRIAYLVAQLVHLLFRLRKIMPSAWFSGPISSLCFLSSAYLSASSDLLVNLILGQLGGGSDCNLLFLTGAQILCAYVLTIIPLASISKVTSICGIPRGAGAMPTAGIFQCDVVGSHLFTLQYVNVHCVWLSAGRENLTFLFGTVWCFSRSACSDSAQCLGWTGSAEDIQQQYASLSTGQYAGLNGCTDRNALIRVDALERFLTGYSPRTAACTAGYGSNHRPDNLVQICGSNAGILIALFIGPMDLLPDRSELIESRSVRSIQMQRTISGGDERQVDLCGSCAGQFLLASAASFSSLQCHVVLSLSTPCSFWRVRQGSAILLSPSSPR